MGELFRERDVSLILDLELVQFWGEKLAGGDGWERTETYVEWYSI